MLFSKALFKQSAKSNAAMWSIITIANCFILSCVMLISGQGNISSTKNAFENTIIEGEIESSLKRRAVSAYNNSRDGESKFDGYYVFNLKNDDYDVAQYKTKCEVWLASKPDATKFSDQATYLAALDTWQKSFPQYSVDSEGLYAKYFSTWIGLAPKASDFSDEATYLEALKAWQEKEPLTLVASTQTAYLKAVNDTTDYCYAKALAIDPSYTKDTDEAKEILGEVMYAINPAHNFDSFYTNNKEEIPSDYDVSSLLNHYLSSDAEDYIKSEERLRYVNTRASNSSSIFLAQVFTDPATVTKLLDALSSYGITQEKYDSFGHDYSNIKHLSMTTCVSYQAQYDYEMSLINLNYKNGIYKDETEYNAAIKSMETELNKDISNSLFNSLPTEVSDALQEVGQMDIYSLIVGSIFFKMAGLLLPIIYMIMCSNNLIAGQVDSGSMAYVLSTGTKRRSVVFTQALYLTISLLAMFTLTAITSCICLSQVHLETSKLNYEMLILMNLGAFLSVFAMSGICFFTSCYFDRSKKAMAIGGGLSMFFLVATMLGLFGTPVLPSIIRLDALNYFNYTSVITLFDVTSIVNGTVDYIYKFIILAAIGLLGYFVGSAIFIKKDLPL